MARLADSRGNILLVPTSWPRCRSSCLPSPPQMSPCRPVLHPTERPVWQWWATEDSDFCWGVAGAKEGQAQAGTVHPDKGWLPSRYHAALISVPAAQGEMWSSLLIRANATLSQGSPTWPGNHRGGRTEQGRMQPSDGSGDQGGQRAVSVLGHSEAQPTFPKGRHLGSWCQRLATMSGSCFCPFTEPLGAMPATWGLPLVPTRLRWTWECSGMCVCVCGLGGGGHLWEARRGPSSAMCSPLTPQPPTPP